MARAIRGDKGAEGDDALPLVAQIEVALTAEIINGRYQPGERIREQELAERFGTSRGPVREAMRLVELDGLIETEHWRGARVVDFTSDEINDLFELLQALFGVVAKLAATHATASDRKAIAGAIKKMASLVDAEGRGLEQLEVAFAAARAVRVSCGSVRAGELLRRISRLAFLQHRYISDADKAWRRRSLVKWRRLQAAIDASDPDGSELAARGIVRQSQIFTMKRIRDKDAQTLARLKPRKSNRRP